MVHYKSIKEEENKSTNQYENSLKDGFSYVKNGIGNCAKKIAGEVKFMSSSLLEAAKESVEKHGIPTKRSYWKEHPIDAALSAISFTVGGATAACDAYVLSDPLNRAYLRDGTLPKDVTLIPPHLHQHKSDGLEVVMPRNLDFRDYFSIALPVALFALPPIIEGVRYHRWKKSIQKVAESNEKH